MLQIQHYDRASLLVGKLHTILQRPYLKGCDLYDLLWYLSDPNWPTPDIVLLNNALRQIGWTGKALTADTWKLVVWEKQKTADLDKAVSDVHPFLDADFDTGLPTKDNFKKLLTDRIDFAVNIRGNKPGRSHRPSHPRYTNSRPHR